MKKLLTLIFVCLFMQNAHAQNKDAYAQISGNFSVSKHLGNGAGGSFGVQHFINNNASFGGGFDIIKYKNLDKILPSVYADFRYHFGTGIKKPLIYFSLMPGYSFYHSSYKSLIGNSYNYYDYKSGFSFGAGLGCILYAGKKMAPFISVAYQNVPLTLVSDEINQTTRYDIIKINFGITF